jgi:protein-disulfide isomerase
MLRKLLSILAFGAMVAASPSVTAQVSLEEAKAEMVVGREDAPITIYAYVSLLCPHCAAFHNETYPKLKSAYLDKGQVRMVIREFPGGRDNPWPAVPAVMARCMGKAHYISIVDSLFREQAQWLEASKSVAQFLDNVFAHGARAGMTREQFDACLQNQDLLRALFERWREGAEQHGVRGTPHFAIGDKTFSGNRSLAEFDELLRPLIDKLPKSN